MDEALPAIAGDNANNYNMVFIKTYCIIAMQHAAWHPHSMIESMSEIIIVHVVACNDRKPTCPCMWTTAPWCSSTLAIASSCGPR
jgi:hypothetical protein